MKKIFLLLVVFGLMFAGLSITDVTASPDTIMSGGYGTVSATISAVTTGVNTIQVELIAYGPIDVPSEIAIGDLDAGASTEISFPIQVEEGAESGKYMVKLKTKGWTETSEGGETYNEKSATLIVDVLNPPILSLHTEKNIIKEREDLTITIVNEGGTAKNLRMSLSDGFVVANKDEVYVGDIIDQKKIAFALDASGADAGANDVKFILEYYDELGNEINKTKTLRLNVVKEDSVVAIMQESGLISNTETALKLKIKNSGKIVSDLKISFPNEDIKLKESDKIDVGDLSANEEAQVEIAVFASLNPGLNQVDVQIEWKEDGEEKSDTLKVPFTVSSDTSIGIYLEAKPTPLKAGQEHTLVVLVSNLGSYKINNVDVGIKSDNLDLLDVQPSDYIGEMNSDDFSTVQFKIKPKKAGLQNVTVLIKYKDLSGKWVSESINKEIMIYEQEINVNWSYVSLAVLVIAGILIWHFKFRKRGTK